MSTKTLSDPRRPEMKIYTKGGDKGKTSLLGGSRVLKSNIRIHAYGTVDELNSYMGLLADQEVNRARIDFIRIIQSTLFTIGSHLAAAPGQDTSKLPEIGLSQVELLEEAIDDMDDALPALKSFLLPGGHQSVSFGHVSRCVCRRAERLVIQLSNEDKVAPIIIAYLNRLSDYLYVLARKMGQELAVEEIPWKGK